MALGVESEVHATSIFRGDAGGQKVKDKGGWGCFGVWVEGGGSVVLRSVEQLFKLALFKLSIVSDFVKCVGLHNLPVLKDCVQQVLEMNSITSWREGKRKKREKKQECRRTGEKGERRSRVKEKNAKGDRRGRSVLVK